MAETATASPADDDGPNWEGSITQNQFNEAMAFNARILREEVAAMFGDRRRNIEKECGYIDEGSLNAEHYGRLYDRDPVAARVIELYPTECWQVSPEIYEDEDIGVTTPFEEALSVVGRSINNIGDYDGAEGNPLWGYLERVDILSGIGRYGVLLLGIDSGKLEEPLQLAELTAQITTKEERVIDPKTKQEKTNLVSTVNLSAADPKKPPQPTRKLLYLRVLEESKCKIAKWDMDQSSPRYGQPEMYDVRISGQGNGELPGGDKSNTETTVKVHWTRLIHVADNLQSSEVLGVPRCQRIYNRLYDLHKLYGGSAEMYWQGALPGISFETIPAAAGVKISEADRTRMRLAMANRREGITRDLILPGLHANSLAPQVVDPSPQIERQIEAICIYLACPKRVFMGSERGELSSNQDTRAWYSRCRKRLNRYVTPRILVPFVNRLIQIGVLPRPEKYCAYWEDASSLTDLEQAQVGLIRMQALKEYIQGGGEAMVTPTDALVHFLGMDEAQSKQIIENKMEDLMTDEGLDLHAREDELAAQEQERADIQREEDMGQADTHKQQDVELQKKALDIQAKAVAAKPKPPAR